MITSPTIVIASALLVGGCALTPRGLDQERAALDRAGNSLRTAAVEPLPLPADPDDWRSLLRRALVANGNVRAAWFEWKAALERVRGASSWPNTNVSVGYSYLFSDERMKTFDRMSFSAGFDSMENLSFPGKSMAAGRVALADARAAGQKFRAAKFSLQRRVLDAWLDLALAAEQERLARRASMLSGAASEAADASLATGAPQTELLEARIASARSDDAAAATGARIAEARAALAALVAIDDARVVPTPTRLPRPRELPTDPTVLLAAVDEGPDVQGLREDRHARKHEEDLARLQWIPDINPYAAATGTIEQMVGALVVLPTTIAEIQSGIATAKAMRGAAAARVAQTRRDRLGDLRAALVSARDAERARQLLERRVLPAAESVSVATDSAYAGGRASLADAVQAHAMLLETKKEIAESAIEREKQLAAMEEILGADLETFTQHEAIRFASGAPLKTGSDPRVASAASGEGTAIPGERHLEMGPAVFRSEAVR